MPIQIIPIISALSNVAGTAWELYRRAVQVNEGKRDKQAQEALAKAVERLEDSHLEQARLISDLSKDLEQFAEAVQAELEAIRRRETRLRILVYLSLAVAFASLGVSLLSR
jgi:phage shock protein A